MNYVLLLLYMSYVTPEIYELRLYFFNSLNGHVGVECNRCMGVTKVSPPLLL